MHVKNVKKKEAININPFLTVPQNAATSHNSFNLDICHMTYLAKVCILLFISLLSLQLAQQFLEVSNNKLVTVPHLFSAKKVPFSEKSEKNSYVIW